MQPNCFDYEDGRSSFLAGSTGFLVDDVEVFVLPVSSTSASTLLSQSQQSQITTFVGRQFSDFSLCYRASEHGYHGYAFHKKCDFKSPTITVIRTHAGKPLLFVINRCFIWRIYTGTVGLQSERVCYGFEFIRILSYWSQRSNQSTRCEFQSTSHEHFKWAKLWKWYCNCW